MKHHHHRSRRVRRHHATRGTAYICSGPLCGAMASSGGTCTVCGRPMVAQR